MKRSVLIAALLVAILGALGIASATEDSGQTPETVVVPPGVVMPRDEPQETQETRTCVFTVTAYCPCEKCCGEYANGYTAAGEKATQGVTIAADPDVCCRWVRRSNWTAIHTPCRTQAAPLPGIGWICILTTTRTPCGGACGKRS